MAFRLDHIVIGVHDLAAAAADFTQAGFQVTPGGEHSSGNTHNALVAFADGAYLELIAFKDRQIDPAHKWGAQLAAGEGFLDFALLAGDLDGEAARLARAGVVTGGVRPLGRLRPDGERIEWLLLSPDTSTHPLPFLIDDLTPRQRRVPGGAATEHPLGVTGVAGVSLLVPDLLTTAEKFAALLDTPGREITSHIAGVASAQRFDLDSQWIELAQPRPDAQDLLDVLAERGPAPYEVSLTGRGSGELLPVARTHQARIRVA
ncbi:MAG: VOC family protein [Chloroflexota bacterium]|nr:VOC family protein [Chloroflexota bacterium]